jgi:uncharacterized protein
MHKHPLTGKVFFITGASSGIGLATCLALANLKVKIAFCARRLSLLKKLELIIKEKQAETYLLNFCITDSKSGKKAIQNVIKKWGRIDFLINNAGIINNKHFHSQSINDLKKVNHVNYIGPAILIKHTLPYMIKKKRGHILNVSSIAGVLGFPFIASYCASKFSLFGLTESLRREYYGHGITFTSFCPGTVNTPMIAKSLKNNNFKKTTNAMSAEKAANHIINCCINLKPEMIVGEIPSFFAKISKFFPVLSDFIFYHLYRMVHPVAKREYLERKNWRKSYTN